MLHAKRPVQFYNMPFPNARSKNEEESHWFLTPVDFWKVDTIMLRNDFTYNLNGCGYHPYAGMLSRRRRLPEIRLITLDGGATLEILLRGCAGRPFKTPLFI